MPHASRSPRGWRRTLVAASCVVAVTLTGIGLAAPAGAAPTGPAPTGPAPAGDAPAGVGGDHTVTLITGDRVHVHSVAGAKPVVSVDTVAPGAGYQSLVVGGDLLVIPDSVQRYLASGILDRDLFDVSLLIRDGYDDARVAATPVILEYQKGPRPFAEAESVPGIDLGAQLDSIGGSAATAAHADAAATWKSLTSGPATFSDEPALGGGIATIHLDGKVRATLDTSVPWIGAPHAWAEGLTGAGVTVAVLDTGYDDTHPDLKGRVLPGSTSFVPGEDVAWDPNGHGTHVASTIAGTGAADGGKYRGVADGANLLVGKVLGADGSGQDSWIIEGMEWAGAHASIVSMSLTSTEPSDGTDLMDQALDGISEKTGTLFVVAAGNDGAPERMGAPGSAVDALTVGSVDDPSGALSWFSTQGPLARSGALKPDIAAPGNEITAARSADSPGEGSYITMSGTSMATPHVAGAAAIVKQQHPDYAAPQLRAAILSSAKDVGLTSYQAGTGALDVATAVDDAVIASGSGDFGMLPWGQTPKPVTRTITYTNRGTAPVTVQLSAALTDTTPGGTGTPASGVLSLDAKTLSIPAGQSRSVHLTADPSRVPAGTQQSGALVGSVNGIPVARTALGIIAEAERYDLTLTATGFSGEDLDITPVVYNLDTGDYLFAEVHGKSTLRLPVGRYAVSAFVEISRTPDTLATVFLGAPDLLLKGAKTVALDARTAKRVSVDVGRNGLEQFVRRMDMTVGDFQNGALASVWSDELWAQPMSAPKADGFDFTTRWRLVHSRLDLKVGRTVLDVIPLVGATPLRGALAAFTVDAGDGSATAFAAARARGRVAVVTRSPSVSVTQQTANAAAAGVKLLVIANDADGEFNDWVGEDDFTTSAGIPVAGISGVQGRALVAALKKHPRSLATAHGDPYSNEVWDLARYVAGSIPTDLTYRPGKLARVDTTFYGKRGSLVGEYRWELGPTDKYGFGLPMPTERGLVRTDWIDPGFGWYQEASTLDPVWTIRDILRRYRPAEHSKTSFFAPIVRPYVGQGYWAPARVGAGLSLNLPGWADGGDVEHTGTIDVFNPEPAGTTNTELYVNGVHVKSSPWPDTNYWEMPDGRSTVRAVVTTTQDGTAMPSSTKTVTAWSFTSTGTAGDWTNKLQPLLQAFYGVPLDAAGTAGAARMKGSPLAVSLQVGHLKGAVGSGPVKAATLQMRTRGGTWVKVPLVLTSRDTSGPGAAPSDIFAEGRAYVATYAAALPVTDAGGWIDLRVTASDTAGNSFSQEITRALDVAPAKGSGPHS